MFVRKNIGNLFSSYEFIHVRSLKHLVVPQKVECHTLCLIGFLLPFLMQVVECLLLRRSRFHSRNEFLFDESIVNYHVSSVSYRSSYRHRYSNTTLIIWAFFYISDCIFFRNGGAGRVRVSPRRTSDRLVQLQRHRRLPSLHERVRHHIQHHQLCGEPFKTCKMHQCG